MPVTACQWEQPPTAILRTIILRTPTVHSVIISSGPTQVGSKATSPLPRHHGHKDAAITANVSLLEAPCQGSITTTRLGYRDWPGITRDSHDSDKKRTA